MANSLPDATGYSGEGDILSLIEALKREASWFEAHPRAHMDDAGLCCITTQEADDTASVLREVAALFERLRDLMVRQSAVAALVREASTPIEPSGPHVFNSCDFYGLR